MVYYKRAYDSHKLSDGGEMSDGKVKKVTKAYMVEPAHVAIIQQVAKDNGSSSASAGLRFIINDWAKRVAQDAGVVLSAQAE